MRHPPYHLRVNKAVDRWLLVELLLRLAPHVDNFRRYSYYGLGGPFLEDLRVLGEAFADLPLTSLEANQQTYLRQRFHQCAKNVTLRNQTVSSFLATASWDRPGVYWLDYTDLNAGRLQEFETLLDSAHEGSVARVTLRAALDDLPDVRRDNEYASEEEAENRRTLYFAEFTNLFDTILPPGAGYGDLRPGRFPSLLQGMLKIVSQRALPPGSGRRFQILHSCFYSDHTQMLSLTGVVCRSDEAAGFRKLFALWPPRNLRWGPPARIDMPVLSTKERLVLESLLPTKKASGRALRRALGYNVDDGLPASIRQLKQYAMFYRYYPLFGQIAVV